MAASRSRDIHGEAKPCEIIAYHPDRISYERRRREKKKTGRLSIVTGMKDTGAEGKKE